MPMPPRGTLVLDIGRTNTKLALFEGEGDSRPSVAPRAGTSPGHRIRASIPSRR